MWGGVPSGGTVGDLEDPSGRGGHDTEGPTWTLH